jgi:hypothetical protein
MVIAIDLSLLIQSMIILLLSCIRIIFYLVDFVAAQSLLWECAITVISMRT